MTEDLWSGPGSLPSDASSSELADLSRLASSLRLAHADPELPPAFAERLRDRLKRPRWSFRQALRRSAVLRAAAALLLFETAAVPLLAWFVIQGEPAPSHPVIQFELPGPASLIDSAQAAESGDLSPQSTDIPSPSVSWQNSLEQANRLSREAVLWHDRYGHGPRGAARERVTALYGGLEGSGTDRALLALIALRARLPQPPAPLPVEELSTLPPVEAALWLRVAFERRLLTGDSRPPSRELEALLARTAGADPVARAWLYPWLRVLWPATEPLPPRAAGGSFLATYPGFEAGGKPPTGLRPIERLLCWSLAWESSEPSF